MNDISVLLQYIDEMEKDVQVDELCMKEVQMRLPAIKHKWVGRLIRHKHTIKQLWGKKVQLKNEIKEKMKQDSKYGVSDAGLDKLIEKQQPVVDIVNDIQENELIVEFLEKSEKVLSSLSFDLKNLVEIIKLETL